MISVQHVYFTAFFGLFVLVFGNFLQLGHLHARFSIYLILEGEEKLEQYSDTQCNICHLSTRISMPSASQYGQPDAPPTSVQQLYEFSAGSQLIFFRLHDFTLVANVVTEHVMKTNLTELFDNITN